ncbi:polyketide antibiotic transporter [Amnibacterium kyonggiense]|uniref:ABC-2 type transport system permease protein n=1 Tax=Amnibacterium kyonggiense TaxID=595671 RepID=A0A4R7FKS1_9MICO|nr:polyketide antibiotic transporter [Amnibacterium kyonggiense]TDS76948.1 ABC-2 type transport system permease protein [Amnibacterium kyonggiense]
MIRLLALQARRDRVTLAVWVLGLAVLLLVTVQASHAEYGTAADRRSVLTIALATPAILAFRGVVDGDSFGSALFFQTYTWMAVAVALMNTFLAVRHGRGDEAAGRRELVDATPVGRLAAPVATMLLAVAADAAFGALATAFLVAGGMPAGGSALLAAGLTLTGLGFFGVGLLASEAMPTSRGANGVGVVLALLAYALRAAGDALGVPDGAALTLAPAAVSGFSPIGWGEQLRPYTTPTAWPLAALAGFAVLLVGAGLVIHARREPGASAVRERVGRPEGRIAGPLGLALRLQWPSALAWTIGAGVLALVTPNLVAAASRFRLQDAVIARVVESLGHTRGDLEQGFTTGILVLVGLLAAAAGVQAMLRAREEEASGRAEALLAGPVSRLRLLAAWGAVAVGTVVAVLLVSAAAVAAGTLGQGRSDAVGERVLQTLVQAPSALALTAVAALLVGLLPRLAVLGAWVVFGAAALIGLFGGILDLPADLVRFSPVGSVPALPTHDWGPTWAVGAAAVVLAALAALSQRRREVA